MNVRDRRGAFLGLAPTSLDCQAVLVGLVVAMPSARHGRAPRRPRSRQVSHSRRRRRRRRRQEEKEGRERAQDRAAGDARRSGKGSSRAGGVSVPGPTVNGRRKTRQPAQWWQSIGFRESRPATNRHLEVDNGGYTRCRQSQPTLKSFRGFLAAPVNETTADRSSSRFQ